jgi:hypothetical protein
MPKDTPKKYCSFVKFLEINYPDVLELFSNACALPLLRPKFGAGITLIMPDAEKISSLRTLQYGPNPEEVIPELKALVVGDYLPTPTAWMSKKDDIPNMLNQKIGVDSADAKSVKLTCGAVLTPNKLFAPYANRSEMAIWDSKGGHIPLNGPPAEHKYTRKARPASDKPPRSPKSKGATGGSGDQGYNTRKSYIESLEARMLRKINEGHTSLCEDAVRATTSLGLWLYGQRRAVFDAVKSYFSYCPITTLYVLLQPHCDCSHPLITDSDVESWLRETGGRCACPDDQVVHIYIQLVDVAGKATTDAEIDRRRALQENLLTNKQYKPVLAKAALESYNGNIARACIDEMRFMLDLILRDLADAGSISERKAIFNRFLIHVQHFYANPAGATAKNLICMNQELQNITDTPSWFFCTFAFVRSDAFHYIVLGSKKVQDPRLGPIEYNAQTASCSEPFNLSGMQYKNLAAMKLQGTPQIDNADTIQTLGREAA